MSQKKHKKLKQLFRREIREKVREMTDEYFGQATVFKIKPNWCPQWIWSKCIAFVIDDSFMTKYEIEKRKWEQKEKSRTEHKAEENASDDSARG